MNYNNKRFRALTNTPNGETSSDTIFEYFQDGNVLTGNYSGGEILHGHLIGIVDAQGNIDMRYHHVSKDLTLKTGVCRSKPEILEDGRIQLHEEWQWTSGDGSSGKSTIEEI